VIGGFAVIANGFLRATKDSHLLVPDGQETDEAIVRFLDRIEARRLRDGKVLTLEDVQNAQHVRVESRHGIIDVMRGSLPPLDYDTVAKGAIDAEVGSSLLVSPACAASSASSVSPDVPKITGTSKSWSHFTALGGSGGTNDSCLGPCSGLFRDVSRAGLLMRRAPSRSEQEVLSLPG
jgi:hypothetical protein